MKYTYEMNPCRKTGNDFERCEEADSDIAVWSVYRRGADGLAEWLSDHATKSAATKQLARHRAAQSLGRLGKGKKKTLAPEEIERRKKRLSDARAKRWPKKDGDNLASRQGRREDEV
jgi:hypothetical protein